MSPLNDEYVPTKREQFDEAFTGHSEVVAQVGLTIALAIGFTMMGAPPVALGIIIGLVVALAIGLVR